MNEGIYKQLRIKEIVEEVKGFKSFVFEEGHGISYKSGQYLTLVKWLNGKEIRRSYSITSSPVLGEPLTIGVKRIENGIFSRELIDKASPGDILTTTGSGGLFTLPDDIENYTQLFFFAAGSGITPVYSLLKTALHSYPHLHIVLIYSNAGEHKTIFLPQLRALQKAFPQKFHLQLLFSNAPLLAEARLHRDLIHTLLLQHAHTDKSKILCYVCGPVNYMRMCIYSLKDEDIPAANIRQESFVVQKVRRVAIKPPDTQTHTAIVAMQGQRYEFPVHYPDTILTAAKKAGISLPYSCEVGRCGNCVAKCAKGKVWHSYNEVLLDQDLQKGLVLTCTGHPVNGDVELDI